MIAILTACTVLAGQAWAEVVAECVFSSRADISEVVSLDGHAYRVSRTGQGLVLEARYADGRWLDHGALEAVEAAPFRVFTHWPDARSTTADMVEVLTIHESGNASLLVHHGRWGNPSQYQRAWVLQGSCSAD